jgi:hypothetical protein
MISIRGQVWASADEIVCEINFSELNAGMRIDTSGVTLADPSETENCVLEHECKPLLRAKWLGFCLEPFFAVCSGMNCAPQNAAAADCLSYKAASRKTP